VTGETAPARRHRRETAPARDGTGERRHRRETAPARDGTGDELTAAELDRCADAGVRVFLAAYRA